MNFDKLKGYGYILLSVIFFYLMSVSVKLITKNGNIPGVEVSFFRFLIGMIIVWTNKIRYKQDIKPVNKKAVFARAFLNTFAVILFFVTIQLTTTTKANIYNMTYPIFVAIFAPIFLKNETFNIKKMFAVILAFYGTYLISGIKLNSFDIADIFGILMGVVAGLAIVSLRAARLTDKPSTILFYLMNTGTVVTLVMFFYMFKMPNINEFILLIIMGVLSFLGQYTITKGYKYVSAVEGSVLSATRIFIASIIGILFLNEPNNFTIFFGGTLIFLAILILNINKVEEK
ncbi:MAG: putative secreted protein [Fusobacteriales bacterium]|jgi:drug/metabolite transporter (DMT)-like permease|nr:putative secreted protein [Fusobacteriales bacterium]